MLAASFWSLLQPAIDLAQADEDDGGLQLKNLAFVPAAIGLALGAGFIILADRYFPEQSDYLTSSSLPKYEHVPLGDSDNLGSFDPQLIIGMFVFAWDSIFFAYLENLLVAKLSLK